MEFEWDANKREHNRHRHRVDLLEGSQLFDGRPVITLPSPRGDEARFATTGLIGAKFYTVIWMERGGRIRLISLRRARDAEERAYQARFG
ncbi:MAG: BrnT family toxin [Acetobacteraceae bacterium]|nr:BrnT family toxin [Acetobacteraceae bacterium]